MTRVENEKLKLRDSKSWRRIMFARYLGNEEGGWWWKKCVIQKSLVSVKINSGQSEHSVSDEDVDSLSVWRQEDKNIAFFEFSGLSSSHDISNKNRESRIIECWAIKKKGKSFQRCRSYAHFASFDIYINLFLLSFHVFHFSSLSPFVLELPNKSLGRITFHNIPISQSTR